MSCAMSPTVRAILLKGNRWKIKDGLLAVEIVSYTSRNLSRIQNLSKEDMWAKTNDDLFLLNLFYIFALRRANLIIFRPQGGIFLSSLPGYATGWGFTTIWGYSTSGVIYSPNTHRVRIEVIQSPVRGLYLRNESIFLVFMPLFSFFNSGMG